MKNSMNILVIRKNNPFSNSSASNNRFLTLAQGLVERGCNMDCLILNGPTSRNEKKEFNFWGVRGNIKYEYLLPQDCSNIFVRQIYRRVFTAKYYHKRVLSIIENNHYDYIWLHSSEIVIEVGLMLFRTTHALKFFNEQSEFSWISFNKKDIHTKYLNEFLPRIDTLSVMTLTLYKYYEKYVGEKTSMIHLPMTVDFARFQNIKSDDIGFRKPYIAYCGTLSNTKDGVNILIEAFLRISKKFPELHLYLAGPLIPRKDYIIQKELIKKGSANDKIIHLGGIERDKIPSFLSQATVLALSRPESKQAEGGFPTKLGEYLATGKPVCVTRVGEIDSYLKNNYSAFIAEPGSVSSFASSLEEALTNKDSLIIGAEGKKIALENFNKDVQSDLLFKHLLQRKDLKIE